MANAARDYTLAAYCFTVLVLLFSERHLSRDLTQLFGQLPLVFRILAKSHHLFFAGPCTPCSLRGRLLQIPSLATAL